jgi:DNA polymerase-3 subunit gamma/tau
VALALYRKYRPRTFAELIGQEHVTEPLSQALRTGRLHHAYLFSGPRGCGKTSSARILARSLNCEKGPTPEPCGVCESCRAMGDDGPGSIDVIEIDAASHGGVDDARDLRERAFFTPVAGRFKIYVIDEAHMVSSAGFNALLKLVEEPPDYVKFVFATTEPEKVLPTIKSRTHHYPFRLVPPSILRPYLERLCAAEGVAVEPAVYPLVVRAGGGSVRDALSVLDQLIAGAGPEGVGYARAVALLGVTDVALLDELCDALAAGDGAAAFQVVDRVVDAGHDPRRFASDLLERLRDLIVMQQVPDAASKGLLDAPADQLDRMAVQASQLGPATLTRCAEIVHNGLVEMRGTASPRLLLELICARMLLPGADDAGEALLHRLERMERRLGAADSGAPPAPPPAAVPAAPVPQAPPAVPPPADPTAPPPADPASPASTTPSAPPPPAPTASAAASPPAAGTLDAAAIRRVWDEIVATVGRRSKRAAAVVREATVRDVDGDTIVLLFQHTVHATMLAGSPQPLLDAVHDVLGGSWQIRCEARDTPGSPAAQRGAPVAAVPSQSAQSTPPAAPAGRATAAADWPEPARPGGARAEPAPPMAAPVGEAGNEIDEVDMVGDARTTVASSEQQALDLLQQSLGAEKIGEVAP